ncbi:alpha/beta hydrolase [Terrimonas sp. NA20]|uniref:Alpha/beta hydrolase n=1 Tax=Terrimonas ginsenosidimutans TaxID=2908004 RepID=A0ABS9KKW7_9BACT|nr:alpha/beta fold hydrolase [Terrimonas ginsenosidimutans]MCG2612949.1 alpha/beta hydrolase [Terrimonas ginsenosidimutans]
MKKYGPFLLSILFSTPVLSQENRSVIEVTGCPVKIGPGVVSVCGYLVAPENRKKPAGNKVKVPFIFVRKAQSSATKNITLFTTGGPGYSTVSNIDSIGEGSGWLAYGGFIAFDQRGSKRSIPNLECTGVSAAIQRSYREGLDRDSLSLIAIRQCRKEFTSRGIDLSSYTTIESAADINDLRIGLGIDSLNLVGISYSGGLMLTVARNHPEAVRTLVLGSPLPGFVNYEEQALFNINEALENFFDYCNSDTAVIRQYGDLRSRFRTYFTSITNKAFHLKYSDKQKNDSFSVKYGKEELMEVILNGLSTNGFSHLPKVMSDIINGNHAAHVTNILDGIFSSDQSLSHGMRYSLYCTEQIAYADPALIKKQSGILPWLAGFSFNNVDHEICKCWNVRSESPVAKTPVYSAVPALIAAGDIDPWCSPFYNRLIKRTMPNAQLLFFKKRGHVPGYGADGVDYLGAFFANPLQPLTVKSVKVWKE